MSGEVDSFRSTLLSIDCCRYTPDLMEICEQLLKVIGKNHLAADMV